MTCGTGAFRFGVGCDCAAVSTGYYFCCSTGAIGPSKLFALDVADGVVTEIGSGVSSTLTSNCAGLEWSSTLSVLIAAFPGPGTTSIMLLEVDPQTGVASTATIRHVPGITSIYGIAQSPITSSNWYMLSDQGSTASLYRISINATTTATAFFIGNIGQDLTEGDLAFDADGVLFGGQVAAGDTNQFKIGTIDLSGGSMSLLGTQVASTMDLSGMAFSDDGETLYGVGSFGSTMEVRTIDKSGGAGSPLFNLTMNSSAFSAPLSGTMGFCKIPEGAT